MTRQRGLVIVTELGKEADGAHHAFEAPGAFAAAISSHALARRRRPLETLLIAGSPEGDWMRLRKIAYALASLAALAMAVGAGWRPF